MKQWTKYLVYLLSALLIFTSISWQSVNAQDNKTSGESQKEDIENVLVEDQTDSVNGGEKEEILSLRSETSKTYSNPDSTYTTEISEEPIHYKEVREDSWLPIDNTLVPNAAEGTVVNKANSFKAEFNEQTNANEAIVEVQKDEFSVSLTPVSSGETVPDTVQTNLETVEGVLDKNTIVYSDVYPNVDIKYTVGTDKVKEDIILKQKPEPDTPTSFSFTLDLNGLSYKVLENNQVVLLDTQTQEPVFYLEAPFMYDSYKPKGYQENPGVTSFSEETLSYDISMSIEQREDQLFIELVPNRKWLESEERVYPVVIDPTIAKFQPGTKLEDTNIRSHFPNNAGGTETTLGVGLYQDASQTNNIRSLLKFDVSSLPKGTKVLDANLTMWLSSVWNDTGLSVDLHQATNNWTEAGATWLKRDGINSWNKNGGDFSSAPLSSVQIKGLTDLSTSYKWSFPGTDVQRWIHNPNTNKGLLLKASNETVKSWKKFVSSDEVSLSKQTPLLAITYISGSRLGLEEYWSYSDHDLADAQGHVNLGTGNLVIESTDFSLNGRGNSGFSFERTYNSKSIEHSVAGYGWAFSGSETITEYSNGDVLMQESDGTTHLFPYDKLTSKYTAPLGLYLSLTKSIAGLFTVTETSGNRKIFQSSIGDTQTNSNIYNIAFEEDRNKNRITYKRQNDGKLLGIADATGRTLSFQYQNGKIISTSYAGIKKSAYTYYTDGRLKTSTNFKDSTSTTGSTTAYQYNSEGQLSIITDANGGLTKYLYQDSYLRSVEQPLITESSSIITYDYSNLTNFIVSETNAKGNKTTYKLNSNYMITSITDPMAFTTTFTYDSKYNMLTIKTPEGNVSTNTFDLKGNLLSSTDSLGDKFTYTYNNFGQPLTVSDVSGTIYYTYNIYGDLINEKNVLGEVTSYTYHDSYGNLESVKRPDGSVETYEYDAQQNYKTQITDALNRTVSISADDNGNINKEIDANGNVTSYQYDKKNQLTSVTDRNKFSSTYNYDANGNLTTLINGNGNSTKFKYNSQNQLVSRTEPLGQVTNLRYDVLGNLIEISQADGISSIKTEYDANNRPTIISVNNYLKWKYGYDSIGNKTSVKNEETGELTTFTYDELSRQKTESNGKQLIEYGYSKTHNISSIKGISGLSNFTKTFDYDGIDQLKNIYRNGSLQVGIDYTPVGVLAELRYANGINSSYSYDEVQQLHYLKVNKGATVLSEETNDYDLNGNLTSVVTTSGKKTFSYDSLNQLKKQVFPEHELEESYTYDGAGNRLTKTTIRKGISDTISFLYDANNRLISNDGTTYSYDKNGNRLKDGNYIYTYNKFDRLTSIKTLSGLLIASYTYDEQERRTSKTIDGITTYFHYDQGINVLYETDSNGFITVEYSYDLKNLPLTMTKNGKDYYYIYNSKQEIVALSDPKGIIIATYDYDAWGNIISKSESTEVVNPFKYKGYRYDVESDLYYLVSRYYNPEEGVFLGVDPVAGDTQNPDSQNGYNYAGNNPISFVDRDGHAKEHVYGGAPSRGLTFKPRPVVPKTMYINKSAKKHVVDRHVGNKKGWSHKSKWTLANGGDWITLSRKTFKNPNKVTVQKNGNIVFEKKFNYSVGKDSNGKNCVYIRVVIDKNGNLVTAFPQTTYMK